SAVERGLRLRAGGLEDSPRQHPGHDADRDAPRRLRDGGVPLRNARARHRAQRRPVGLNVPLIQSVPNPEGQGPPGPAQVTMTVPFMRAYTELLIKSCHTHGAHAMGGMAPFIPSRKNPEINEKALAKVREDKLREVNDGFDGTWVAHPDLVPTAKEVFD